jgi:hypothetical protein
MGKLKPTNRGFLRGDFEDLYGQPCSIQESSLATEDAIWLGCNEGTHTQGHCSARMHLNQDRVKDLLPLLEYFAKCGKLPDSWP